MNFPGKILQSMALASTFFCVNALADYVVLESSTEDFAPGQLVSDPQTLEIPAGAQLVLMSQNGETLRLDGSAVSVDDAAQPENDIKLMLANLVNYTRDEHISLGGTRGGIDINADDETPLWSVNPYVSGIQCVVDDGSLIVYRPDTRSDLELTVSQPGTEYSGLLQWAEGEHETRWPGEVPVVNGGRYVIKRAGWMESSLIQVQSLPETVANQQATAVAWLAANKCVPQAEKLLTTLD